MITLYGDHVIKLDSGPRTHTSPQNYTFIPVLLILSQYFFFRGSGLHPYVSQNPQLTLSEAVPVINDWKGGVGLIFEMEMAMKSRGLLPSSDNPQNTIFLKFEWQFFGNTASKHVCDSSVYILPVPAADKLFIRCMEKGVYKGFTNKFLPVLVGKYNLTPQDTYLYNIYTDKDMAHESQLNKYEGQATCGFYQLMYHNQTSVGHLLGSNNHVLKHLHGLAYLQKKNARPNKPMDK